MAKINKIKLSGTSYDIQDLNASKTVELTQAQYDALVTKDPNTFYIITDAQGGDLSNYYTKSETSGATQISTALNAKADTATTYTKTEVDTALSGKQDTLSAGTNITIVDNVISATGGGASYSAGTGIDITNNVISVSGVVETSAITTAITSSSTDAQVPSAKAVNDKLGGLSLVKLTQAEYDALSPNYDSNTLYVVTDS